MTAEAQTGEGPAAAGLSEPLVMIPGIFGDAVLFGPQMRALSGVLPVMVAPPLGGERVETIARHLLDQLPPRFALLGHGLGGVVAMEIIRRAPERVARLCLMSTTPLPDTPDQAAAREPQIIAARTGRLEEALRACLPADALGAGAHPSILTSLYEQGLMLGEAFFITRSRAMQRRSDQQASLRRYRGPTLALCGGADPITPPMRHEFIANMMPNARLQVIEGAGHLPTLEAPQEVTTALAHWLAAPLEDADLRAAAAGAQKVSEEKTDPPATKAPLPPLTLTNPL
ncbi:alpha/beta hydrolase [Phaeobacter italicus]|jgi:pimeloyl-ACP methyl ester carboxylesterase|uniref:alpha/beta fold hydrolase n=1 Tax=Phaeobacter italicus TaxID=481446 RepID=UPI001C94592D|nr:alpha/beta hydrolase [Phaeobacter italicus]MBY5976863.1 alpha/beta hydrolase [Phaeobacter italicus]